MEDSKIVALFFDRSQDAISETASKYGNYCKSIAISILSSEQDAEECVNDTLFAAWNSIPPAKPQKLSAYLGKIVRNFSITRLLSERAEKRRANASLLLDEVGEFIPDPWGEAEIESILTSDLIDRFLASLPVKSRMIFVRRYWYMSPIAEISKITGLSEGAVKMSLSRTRNKFRDYLDKEGKN